MNMKYEELQINYTTLHLYEILVNCFFLDSSFVAHGWWWWFRQTTGFVWLVQIDLDLIVLCLLDMRFGYALYGFGSWAACRQLLCCTVGSYIAGFKVQYLLFLGLGLMMVQALLMLVSVHLDYGFVLLIQVGIHMQISLVNQVQY